MKRLLLTVALCVAASTSFAQMSNVKTAQRIAKGEKPDFGEARTLIKSALENPESKDNAQTWYVAGFIENQQFDAERMKQMLGQQPNEPIMYDALGSILPYFMKAYDLDQQPNEKGKIKPKYSKDIKSILGANHIYYINGGAYYFEQKDYKKAYDFFNQYLEISDLDMFKGEQVAARDSNYQQIKYYAGVAASLNGDSKTAVKQFEDLRQYDYKANEVLQTLAEEYRQMNDTVSFERILKEGVEKFPKENYYLLSLINIYIYANKNDEAIACLDKAIAQEPSAQLYDVKGKVYETNLKDDAKAEECFNKALEIDPNYAESISNLGRLFYNQGVNQLNDANMLTDAAEYQAAKEKAIALFKKALPYFEKVHKMKPEDREAMTGLRGIYYNLNMGPEFETIEAEMNK